MKNILIFFQISNGAEFSLLRESTPVKSREEKATRPRPLCVESKDMGQKELRVLSRRCHRSYTRRRACRRIEGHGYKAGKWLRGKEPAHDALILRAR